MGAVTNQDQPIATMGSGHVAIADKHNDVCLIPKKPKDEPFPFPNWVHSTELVKGTTTKTTIGKQQVWNFVGQLGPPSEPGHPGKKGGVNVKSRPYLQEATPITSSCDTELE